MIVLSRAQVEKLLDLDRLIDALGPAMAQLSAGHVSMPPRIVARVPEHGGWLAAMPVSLAPATLATKLVSVFPSNIAKGLESHQALIALFDASTGLATAVMDGSYITAMRTAAGSALASRLLARADADILTIIGTGVQARAHAQAIPRVRPIKEVRVVGRSRDKAESLARKISAELHIPARACAQAEEAARGARIICAATHSAEPVICGRWLEPGAHVNSVGYNIEGREVDGEAMAKSLLVVESRAVALAPPPVGANDFVWAIRDGMIAAENVHAEIGELVSGARPGRTSDSQITLYKSVGVAVQDAVAAQLVMEAAAKQGVGTTMEI